MKVRRESGAVVLAMVVAATIDGANAGGHRRTTFAKGRTMEPTSLTCGLPTHVHRSDRKRKLPPAGALHLSLRGGDASEVDVPTRKRQTLRALHLTSFLAVASTSMVVFAPLPSLTSHLSKSPDPQARAVQILSLLSSASAAVELFLSPSVGAFIDAKGRNVAAAILNASIMGANLGAVLRPGVWSVCVSRMVNALSGGFLLIVVNTIIADVFSTSGKGAKSSNNDQMGSVLGRQAACVSLGFLLGSLIGGRLTEWGERAAYGGALALSTLATLNVVFRTRDSLEFVADKQKAKKDETLEAMGLRVIEAPLSSARLLFAYGSQMRTLAALMLLQSMPAFMGDVFQLFAREQWGFQPKDFANLVALFGVLGIFSNVSLPFVLRSLGIRNFSLFAIASALLFPIMAMFADSFQPLLVVGCLGMYGSAQKVGTSTAITSLATERGIPQGQLQGEKASMLAALKVLSPLVYSTLYLKGKAWANSAAEGGVGASGLELVATKLGRKLPFVLNIVLGMCAFAVTWQNL
ncbi:hypothetical protein ACHAXT_001983 [Thalassiosira profunda]